MSFNPNSFAPKHFRWAFADKVGTVTLDRPEKKNPLTFESYAELRDLFRSLHGDTETKTVVITGAGGNFCSGGDVFEIIEPLTKMQMPELLSFTQMTGDLICAMLSCPQTIVAAVDGICVGAGAAIAMASDLRIGTPRSKVAFLFSKVGLAGCDMGSCSLLPRLIGHGRAAELLYSGRSLSAEEALNWGFFSELVPEAELPSRVIAKAGELANGPTFAHAMTKRMLLQEWDMSVLEAVEAEAQAQAICMQTQDFRRAFEAFAEKRSPNFQGN
ncbi:MAG: enoyl-CoA hydratase family protein [Bdellovibrionales bacterium]|nr:enoyl-CoA hydratase family protein [Bdellovibrionales bacterium]